MYGAKYIFDPAFFKRMFDVFGVHVFFFQKKVFLSSCTNIFKAGTLF